jgi:hypothetical protein
LTANELQGVEEIIIREAQMEVYCQEITALKERKSLPKRSSILNLTPIWKDGLLRSNTRLRYTEDLSEDIKYPIILPKRYPVTKLIVKYHHESEGHRMGVNFTLNHLRERYRSWPRNGKENGKRMHNVQTEFYRQTRRATNGTIAQYQIRVDDETFHELCS